MKRLLPVILLLGLTLFACEKEAITEGEQATPSTYQTIAYLNDKARELSDEDPAAALEAASEALELASQKAYLEGQKQSHNTLYFIYLQLKDFDKAEYHSNTYLALTEEVEKAKDLIYANYKQGMLHYQNDELDKAMPFLFEACDLSSQYGGDNKAAYSLYAISKIFEKTGDANKGLHYLKKIDHNVIDSGFVWSIYHQQAKLLAALNKYSKAKEQYEKTYALVSLLNKPEKELKVLNDLVYISIELDEYDEAEQLITLGVERAKALNNSHYLGKLYWNKGYLAEKSTSVAASRPYYEQAHTIFAEAGYSEQAAQLSLALSRVCLYLGEADKAKAEIAYSTEIFDSFSSSLQADILAHQARIATAQGDSTAKLSALYRAGQLEIQSLKNSQAAGVHKAGLAYKEKIKVLEHEAFIEGIHKEMAAEDRQAQFYKVTLVCVLVLCVVLAALYPPYSFLMGKARRVVTVMEELQLAFKRRMAGSGPLFPTKETAPRRPELPDERDLHNLHNRGNRRRKDDDADNDTADTNDDHTT
ncbi:MAG: hypothetical protein WBB45_19945 [Cyclobacteriaceae bacterium]